MTLGSVRRAGVAWALVLVGVLAILAAAVDAGSLHATDQVLLRVAQAPASGPLDWAMALVSLLGSIEVTGILAALLVVFSGRLPWTSWERWLPLAVLGLVTLIELGGKLIVHQPSPPLAFLRGPKMPGVGLDTGFSFPSGHMTRVALVFGLIALRMARLAHRQPWLWVCVGAVWGIGFSRVYLGEHWPADVAGGILLGGAGLALCIAASPGGTFATTTGLSPPEGPLDPLG